MFYTDVHDPGGSGLYDPRETRHVVEINLGLLRPLGIAAAAREFPIDAVESAAAREVQRADRRALRAAQSRRGVAEQAMAAGAARRGCRARCATPRPAGRWCCGDPARSRSRARRSPRPPAPRCSSAEDDDRRPRRAGPRRGGDGVGRHRADAHRGGGRHAARRHLRTDAADAQRSMGAGRHHRCRATTICQCHHLRRCRLERMCLLDIEVAEVAARARSAAGGGRDPCSPLERLARLARVARVRARARRCCGSRSRRVATLAAGAPIAIVGEALRVWAAGHLNKAREVTSSGRIAGSRIRCTSGRRSWASASRSRRGSVLVAALDRGLSGGDADRGDQERGSVPAPRVRRSVRSVPPRRFDRRRSIAAARRRFSLAQAIANREHRAVAGLVVAMLLLLLKATYNGMFWRASAGR